MTESELAFDEAIAAAATGDIWLFRGKSLADRAIQTLTNSPVNHVGMCVALDDMPALLWHAELGEVAAGRVDRRAPARRAAAQARRRGAHLGRRKFRPGGVGAPARGQPPLARAGEPPDRDDRQIRWQAVPDHGRPGALVGDRARAPARGLARDDLLRRARRRDSCSTWGCSPDKRPISWYDPGKFWSGDEITLVEPFVLGEEMAVR